jgi:Reverse transcriptase (RNA-dependent DNA polymerase)/RNase H-like domain found in reverse transcriptase
LPSSIQQLHAEFTATDWGQQPPLHHVVHAIETKGRPVTAKFRRLDPGRLEAAKAEFKRMLDAGIIRRSKSQWSSPLHMVLKKDGTWRPCGDFCRLNLITAADCYPLPNMADCSARLDGCQVFSKLDLQKGYLQVPVAAEDIPKTAVITTFGLFEFIRMPFGLKNAGMTFQRMMDQIFADIPYVFIYLDDVLVASRDMEEHQRHLRQVLSLLQANGLQLNAEKCVWAIQAFPRPATVKDLQAFLGLFTFYRRFVAKAAAIVKPLTDALKGGKKGSTKLEWTADMATAFQLAKQALADACPLDHPSATAELSLATDASSTHVGGVLQQQRPGST